MNLATRHSCKKIHPKASREAYENVKNIFITSIFGWFEFEWNETASRFDEHINENLFGLRIESRYPSLEEKQILEMCTPVQSRG